MQPTVGQPYDDEFQFLEADARDAGIPWTSRPAVDRVGVPLRSGRRISAIRWGVASPELALLHGGAQNAHAWDAVALALARPLVAVDLPGHGHSDWREDRRYQPVALADEVAEAIAGLCPRPVVLVGMSMGGLVALRVASQHPQLLRCLVMVDITPGHRTTSDTALNFFQRKTFPSFEDLLAHASSLSGRTDDAARRTVMHNARRRADGTWEWRHHMGQGVDARGEHGALWDDLARLHVPVLLVRGGKSRIVTDDHLARFRALQPAGRVEVVPGAGHNVQRSQPRALAELLGRFGV